MSDCDEGCTAGKLIEPQRNNYFYGKLLDERNLSLEQGYLNQKRWMLNRLGLGKGVLCGLTVSWTEDRLCISAGVAIDGRGREIVVPEPILVDPWQSTDDRGRAAERLKPDAEHEVYICLAYLECPTDFTPVLVTDCDSANRTAPSMISEKYAVIVKEVTENSPRPLPMALDPDLCEALADAETDAETRRKEVCGVLSARSCVGGDLMPCVVLASSIALKGDKIRSVDVCSARPVIYSNPELFEMLLCRSGGGAGTPGPMGPAGPGIDSVEVTKLACDAEPWATLAPDANHPPNQVLQLGIPKGCDGKPGQGLDADLPKILDIGWKHDDVQNYYIINPQTKTWRYDFLLPFLDDSGKPFDSQEAQQKTLRERILSGKNVPPFTIYFNRILNGVDQQTFCLSIKVPVITGGATNPKSLGIYITLEIVGDILNVTPSSPTKTPHTNEEFAYAASFVPKIEFLTLLLPYILMSVWGGTRTLGLPEPTFQVQLKGDFIWAADGAGGFDEGLVLDADNIGGNVGVNRFRAGKVLGGHNPSGNLTQGGDFESWLQIRLMPRGSPDIGPITHTPLSVYASPPISINFATAAELEAAGLTAAQVRMIIKARDVGPIVGSEYLLKLVGLPKTALNKIEGKIFV